MKYAVNSQGKVVSLQDNQSIIQVIPLRLKEKELYSFTEDFISLLECKGIDTKGKGFCYMIQPFYIMERVVFFAKTEFSSSSQAVKLANEMDKHPEIYIDKERVDFLKSIIPEEKAGKTRWYFLNVCGISFERNLYDCKRINIKYIPPVPYAQFVRNLQDMLVTRNDMEKVEACPRYKYFANGVDIWDTEVILEKAFVRDLDSRLVSKFDQTVIDITDVYRMQHFAGRDVFSNKATLCLMAINEGNKHIYDIYLEVKNCIKKTFKNAQNISYKGNCITASIENNKLLTIFVSDVENKDFIIGGETITGIDALKNFIQSPMAFQEASWFAEKVKPYIITNITKISD